MGPALLRHPLHRVHQARGSGSRASPALEVQLLTSTTGAPTLRRAPIVALTLTGELCAYSASPVVPILVELSCDATELLVDLSELALVDAAGLAMFVRLDHVLAQHGGRLHL